VKFAIKRKALFDIKYFILFVSQVSCIKAK